MKHLKWFIALAALLAVPLALQAPAADAASCTASEGQTYWDGSLEATPVLGPCTGVNGAEVRTSGSGWIDYTAGGGLIQTVNAGYQELGATDAYPFYAFLSHPSWCFHNNHQIATVYQYRIRNSVGNTWGSWHTRLSSPYNILC